MAAPASLTTYAGATGRQELRDVHSHWKFFLLEGLLLLVLGLLAVAAPHTSTVSIEQLVGWLLIAAGFIVSATIIRKHHLPSSWWPLSSSVIAMALGVLLVRSPIEGVIALTIVMVALFFIKGIASIVIALACRPNVDNWIWTLLGGLVTLMVAFLMSKSWPSTTAWGLGLYVGINMIYLGAWLILTVIAARGIDSARGM